MPTVLKSGSLNLLEPSGPAQACNGIALPFFFTSERVIRNTYTLRVHCRILKLCCRLYVQYHCVFNGSFVIILFSRGSTAPSRPTAYDDYDHTQTHYTRWDSPGRVISPTQRLIPDNTAVIRDKTFMPPRGIRIHNPSERAAADPRLSPQGQ